jgi:hypothetical protein
MVEFSELRKYLRWGGPKEFTPVERKKIIMIQTFMMVMSAWLIGQLFGMIWDPNIRDVSGWIIVPAWFICFGIFGYPAWIKFLRFQSRSSMVLSLAFLMFCFSIIPGALSKYGHISWEAGMTGFLLMILIAVLLILGTVLSPGNLHRLIHTDILLSGEEQTMEYQDGYSQRPVHVVFPKMKMSMSLPEK